jgi:hypothetical protein
VLNVPLVREESAVTTEMMATTIRPSITAYSTAVGPSSHVKKRVFLEWVWDMRSFLRLKRSAAQEVIRAAES